LINFEKAPSSVVDHPEVEKRRTETTPSLNLKPYTKFESRKEERERQRLSPEIEEMLWKIMEKIWESIKTS
jgi:hypothetical protein